MLAFTRALAYDVAKDRITVNAICPGWIATSRVTSFIRGMGVDDVEAEMNRQAEDLLLGRIGRPEDIAGLTTFLASDAAEWITGQGILIDGGGLATA